MICIVGDIHFGVKSNIEKFIQYQDECFDEMVKSCIENNVKKIIFLGDIFDNRTSISTIILDKVTDKFKNMIENGIEPIILVGNHDTFYKSSNTINTPNIVLGKHMDIHIVENTPEVIELDGVDTLFVPWINKENMDKCLEQIKLSNDKYCFGHFEINNFLMNSYIQCSTGLPASTFKRFEKVFSGHFHTKSESGNILYTGSLHQITWNDYGDKRGFYFFKPEDGTITFNPFKREMFQKIIINDNIELDSFRSIKDSYIKIYINRKLNTKEEKFLSEIIFNNIEYEVIDNTIIEDINDVKFKDESINNVVTEFVDIQENLNDQEKSDIKNLLLSTYTNIMNEGY